jgi:hypothetical protein
VNSLGAEARRGVLEGARRPWSHRV